MPLNAKGTYLSLIRSSQKFAGRIGVLDFIDERAHKSRRWLWARSLFAIYDFEQLVDLDLPWWTFDSIDLIEQRVRENPDQCVFEWGSGASTIWLAQRFSSVTTTEHDQAWAEQIVGQLPENVDFILVPPTSLSSSSQSVRSQKSGWTDYDFSQYVQSIDTNQDLYDLIVVDGRAREACLVAATQHLAPNGIILFDNVERARYREAIAQLGNNWTTTWTSGLTPTLPYPTRTAILQRNSE